MKKYLFILIAFFLLVACSEKTVDIEGEALNYEELQSKITASEQELESINDELKEAKNELSEVKNAIVDNTDKYEGLEELASNRDSITKEFEEAELKLESLQAEISKLEDELVTVAKETETTEKEIVEKVATENSDETLSQKNAVAMAESYLNYTAFSKSGLIEQLKFEGFNDEDATYAVNQISVNWQEQAVKMAESYLDYSSFSKSGLIEQLTFEGFSNEDATYAVNEVGL